MDSFREKVSNVGLVVTLNGSSGMQQPDGARIKYHFRVVVGVCEEAGLLSHAWVEVGDGFDKILAGTLDKISKADS